MAVKNWLGKSGKELLLLLLLMVGKKKKNNKMMNNFFERRILPCMDSGAKGKRESPALKNFPSKRIFLK
jgi:hypothetical protein